MAFMKFKLKRFFVGENRYAVITLLWAHLSLHSKCANKKACLEQILALKLLFFVPVMVNVHLQNS